MTRRVRSGSSQKHKKMPGNATKWGEFDNQHKTEIPSQKKEKDFQKSKSSKSKSPSSQTLQSLNKDSSNELEFCSSFSTKSLNNMSELKNVSVNETYSNVSHRNNEINSENLSTNQSVNPKLKKKVKKKRNFDVKFSSIEEETDKFDSEQKHKKIKLENDCSIVMQNDESSLYIKQNDFEMNKNKAELVTQHKKKKKSKKLKQNNNDIDSKNFTIKDVTAETSLCDHTTFDSNNEISSIKQDIKCINSSGKTQFPDKSFPQNMVKSPKKQTIAKPDKIKSYSNPPSMNNESYKKNPSSKVSENRKSKYLEKLQKKREELGLLLLPRNVECKLHKIKRRLAEKGFPPELQKEIMRKARRKEELKFRNIYNPSKVCFNCREPGHVLADCPKKSESLKQETGICFKCGSVEHISFKCPEKVQGFPFAKCFICKEQGHISRECMKNKHGIYPKGGKCKLCGNINHLKKDCPTLKRREIEEESITLHTLNEDASIDAEVIQKDETEKKSEKKAKIIKF